MQVDLVRMPWGEYVGAAAVAVDVTDDDEKAAAEVIQRVSMSLTMGTACIWIREAPWEAEWWIHTLWGLERTHAKQRFGVPIVAKHRPDDPTWPPTEVQWSMDCSYLVEAEASPKAIAKALEELPLFPRVDGLVIIDPDFSNVISQNLDAIAYTIQPNSRVGQLILPSGKSHDPAVIKAIAQCETPWTVVQA